MAKATKMVTIEVYVGAPAKGFGYGPGLAEVPAKLAEAMIKAKVATPAEKPKAPASDD